MNLSSSYENNQSGSMLLPSVLMMLSLSLLLVGAQQGRIEHQVQILSYQRQLMTVRQQVESTLSQVIATHEWPKPRVASCQRFSSVTVCFKSITAELGIVCAVIQTKTYAAQIRRFSYVNSRVTPQGTTRLLRLSTGWLDYSPLGFESLC